MLCRMSDGSMARISEFRRVGHPCTARLSLYGTEACYEEQVNGSIWTERTREDFTDLTEQLRCRAIAKDEVHGNMAKLSASDDMFRDVAPVHPVHLLPKSFRGMPNGHLGSHQFLVHDFVDRLRHRQDTAEQRLGRGALPGSRPGCSRVGVERRRVDGGA